MRVRIALNTSKYRAEALIEAESIVIDKLNDGLYCVILTTPSGAVYSSYPAGVDDIGNLPSGEKTIEQWYQTLTFRKCENTDSPVTKTSFFG